MKSSKRMVWTAVAWVLATAALASAQVMNQVPNTTVALVKISNLDAVNKKASDFAAQLGIAQMNPDFSDPLGSFLKQIGVTDGVNRTGDMVVAYLDPTTYNTTENESFMFLFPVSDYQKFIGNFPDAKPDGDLTQVHFKNDNDITYLAHWGDYVAGSPVRAIVATAPTDVLQPDGLAAKELDGKDVVVMANLKGLRPKALKGIDEMRQNAAQGIDQALQQLMRASQQHTDMTKFEPLIKLVAGQCLDFAQKICEQMDAATLSFNLSPDGIATTLACQFDPNASVAQYLAQVKNSDDSLLEGLGSGKYLVFGGSSPQQMSGAMETFIAPIEKAITDMGPDYSSFNDWLNGMEKLTTASQGSAGGLLMPNSQPGAGALFQMVGVRRGDAKTMLDAFRSMSEAQQAAMKSLGVNMPGMNQTYTRDSKTVNGISFDEMKSQITPPNQSPQAMQMMQFVNMLYGPNGPDVYVGQVNDQTLLTVMGLDDNGISTAIDAAKAGDDPLAKTSGVKTVAAQLPPQRFAALYVPLDLWATTGFGYAKMFGVDMGVVMPENLPPLGMTLSTDGPAIRGDAYMPAQLLQALTAAGMQVYMKTQNPAPPPGGGPGAPGGL
jgi:hypothetical protein